MVRGILDAGHTGLLGKNGPFLAFWVYCFQEASPMVALSAKYISL